MSKFPKGSALPTVEIANKGEILLEDGKISYGSWTSAALPGKVRTIHHLAGRSSAKEINEALVEALKQADLPKETYQTTTIVNVNDAIFGTAGIVTMMVEGGKKEFPWSSIVVDAKGIAQKTWGLDKESSAIIVLDANGNVLFSKDGALSDAEVKSVLSLIEAELASATA
ncbi:MAG: YtfJ family protein [Hahellaceae bacterium]|nr:YtfJ family protein [Hahellaceae bacterium]